MKLFGRVASTPWRPVVASPATGPTSLSSTEAMTLEGLDGVLARFVQVRHIPDRGRGILENSIVGTGFPIE